VAGGCTAGEQHPEGIVERWLVSLNQGAAGRPDLFAPDEVSEQVLPGWRDLEPGEIDEIEIGADRGARMCQERCADIPFRITDLDGEVTEGIAHVDTVSGSDWRVTSVDLGTAELTANDGAWAPTGAPGTAWVLAIAAAVVLAALGVTVVRLVRGPERETT
jgi:hypothetical protein